MWNVLRVLSTVMAELFHSFTLTKDKAKNINWMPVNIAKIKTTFNVCKNSLWSIEGKGWKIKIRNLHSHCKQRNWKKESKSAYFYS